LPETLAGALDDQLLDGKGNSPSTCKPCLRGRSICGSVSAKVKRPVSGSTSCHFSDQSRTQISPAWRQRSSRCGHGYAWFTPKRESSLRYVGITANRTSRACVRPPTFNSACRRKKPRSCGRGSKTTGRSLSPLAGTSHVTSPAAPGALERS